MKLKKYYFLSLIFIFSMNLFSQEEGENTAKKSADFWKKISFGGGLGLNFGNSATSVIVSPTAVYNFDQKFSAGAGINFGYSSFSANKTRQFNYGASLIGLYNPFNGLQLSTELEYLFVNQSQEIAGEKFTNDFNFPALYIGAAYRIKNISAGLRYDLLYNEDKTIFQNALSPFVRVFF